MTIDKQELINMIKARHEKLSTGEHYTNQHGLYRCDCDEWIEELNEN